MNTKGDLRPPQPHGNRGRSLLCAPVVVSPTHVHLTAASIEALFCDRYRLHALHRLGQPSLYEADETVTLIGPRGHLNHIPIIGPPRAEDQIEVSMTDAEILGIKVPVRPSGQLGGTPGLVIQGPRTCLQLKSGVIRALRHVHMTPAEASVLGVHDGNRLDAVIRSPLRQIILRDILVRVSPNYRLELHLDMDEAHRLDVQSGDCVEMHMHGA